MRKNYNSFFASSRFFTKMLLSILSIFLCCGCLGNVITKAKGEAQSQMQVSQTPQRIVVFPLFAEEMLLEMIEPERIVYVGHEYWENGEVYSPTMELTKHAAGRNWQNSGMFLEINPDLIIFPEDLSIDYNSIFPEIEEDNINVLFLDTPKTIDDIKSILETLGEVVGEQEKAAQMARDMDSELAQIAEIVSTIPAENRVRVAFFDSDDPHFFQPYTFNMITNAAGVININGTNTDYCVVDSHNPDLFKMSETLLSGGNPDLIVYDPAIYDCDGTVLAISDEYTQQYIASLVSDPVLSAIPAILRGNIHPLRLYESQFIVQSVKALARLAYPDIFPSE